MAGLVRYGRILKALSHPKRQSEGGIKLLFEMHSMVLTHDDWLLAMFCLLSLRPKHKGLSSTLWRYIRTTDKPIKTYIHNFAQDTYFDLLYATKHEVKSLNLSKATRRKKNPAYKGEVMGIHMETHETINLVGVEEMEALGFSSSRIYEIVNDRPGSYTHRGYTFVRLEETKK